VGVHRVGVHMLRVCAEGSVRENGKNFRSSTADFFAARDEGIHLQRLAKVAGKKALF